MNNKTDILLANASVTNGVIITGNEARAKTLLIRAGELGLVIRKPVILDECFLKTPSYPTYIDLGESIQTTLISDELVPDYPQTRPELSLLRYTAKMAACRLCRYSNEDPYGPHCNTCWHDIEDCFEPTQTEKEKYKND